MANTNDVQKPRFNPEANPFTPLFQFPVKKTVKLSKPPSPLQTITKKLPAVLPARPATVQQPYDFCSSSSTTFEAASISFQNDILMENSAAATNKAGSSGKQQPQEYQQRLLPSGLCVDLPNSERTTCASNSATNTENKTIKELFAVNNTSKPRHQEQKLIDVYCEPPSSPPSPKPSVAAEMLASYGIIPVTKVNETHANDMATTTEPLLCISVTFQTGITAKITVTRDNLDSRRIVQEFLNYHKLTCTDKVRTNMENYIAKLLKKVGLID